MITYWKYTTSYVEVEQWEPGCWIQVKDPTAADLALLEQRWQAPLDIIEQVSDADERPRLDLEDDWAVAIVRMPNKSIDEDGDAVFVTRPAAVLVRDDLFITVTYFPTEVFNDFIIWSNRRRHPQRKGFDLLLSLLLSASVWYLKYLKQMNAIMNTAEARLEKSMDNNELQKMMGMGKYKIYFIN